MNDRVEVLRSGDVAVIPTDTVYGLACLPQLPAAVEKIFALKGRPRENPLPVLAASRTALESVAVFDERAVELAARFWPGPLTLVLPRAGGFTFDLGGDDIASVAVRVPRNDVTADLLALTGPLAVTSANLSGRPPAATVDEARAIFGARVAAYVDGGPGGGAPSTIVSLVGEPRILRAGVLGPEELLGSLPSR